MRLARSNADLGLLGCLWTALLVVNEAVHGSGGGEDWCAGGVERV